MKLAGIAAIGVLAGMSWVHPAYAQTLNPIDQLRTTRVCKGCEFTNADLKGMDLSGTDLSGAKLGNADLSGANLTNANLSGADLYLAKLANANLEGANLTGANLKAAGLSGANLTNSTLVEANFSYATLPGANLKGADLSKANLSDADLSQASLENAKLINTNFNHTNLTAANVSGADLTGANLETANLKDANFTGANLTAAASPTQSGTAPTSEKIGDSKLNDTKFKAEDSPIAKIPNQLPTAQHLKSGEVVFNFSQRYFFTNNIFSNTATKSAGSPTWSGGGIRWGITDGSELAVAYQNTDPVSIERQGAFNIFVQDSTPTWDFGVEFKQKIWENKSKSQALSGVVSLAGFTSPKFKFTNTATGAVTVENGGGLVPGLAFPYTAHVNDKLSLTISPTLAFFPDSSALFLHRPPTANPGAFGTTFGLTGAISYQVHPRLTLWGEAFFPFVGNNSINRNSGLPDKTLAINAGIRFLVNPRLGIDLYATNTFGALGPLALTADNGNIGFGANLVFMPGIFPTNRENYPNNFKGQFNLADSPLTTDGLGFFDGGTLPAGKVLLQTQAGSGGIMSAARYGVLKDLELGIYLDYVFGKVDESESGIGAKVRFLDQAKGSPFTASGVVTFGQGNQQTFNYTNNQANLRTDKSVPIYFFDSSLNSQNGLIIATVSLPIQYQISKDTAVWLTPAIGYVQRGGFSLAGLNAGGSVRVFRDISLVGEVGANFKGAGNAFIGNTLANRIPWNFAIRWTPAKLFGLDIGDSLARPSFELFVTNRVGSSVWQQFRVRDQNNPAVGVGVSIPF